MAWKTIAYRIERCYVPTGDGVMLTYRHFLDAVQVDEKTGRKSATNICNGTRDYCLERLNSLLPVIETANIKTNREIDSEISEEDRAED